MVTVMLYFVRLGRPRDCHNTVFHLVHTSNTNKKNVERGRTCKHETQNMRGKSMLFPLELSIFPIDAWISNVGDFRPQL